MTLKLAIVHLDMVVKTLELEPGEYSLGRSSENNIVVQHFSLEPQHGTLFFKDDVWFYRDAQGKTERLKNDGVISLSSHMSLTTQEYVESGETKFSDFSTLREKRQDIVQKRMLLASGLVFCLLFLTVGGYFVFRQEPKNLQQNQLLTQVRSKIVEFETVREQRPIEDLKKYGGLTDDDFKESSGFCTGFLVGPNIVLTAAHCLLGRYVIDINNDFYLKTSDGKQHKIEKVLGFDVKRDFLYLKTEGMESYGHLDFAEDYRIEQKIYTVGNVHGEGIAIRDGIISSESADPDEPDVKFIRYSAGTSPGNSGGPLLNSRGEVVALVFASTYSENFNLGTPAEDLVKAYDKFVNEEEKEHSVEIAIKRLLNFKPSVMLQALALPYLPQFDDYPEISQAFSEVKIEVPVPIDFNNVDEAILNPLNKAMIKTFYEVQDILRTKDEIVLDWTSFVTDKTPAILPSQFDASQSVFTKIGDRYFPHVAGLIDSPSKADYLKYREELREEDKFDFQSYGYNIEISGEKYDLLPSDVFYKPDEKPGTRLRLQNLSYGVPYSQLLIFEDGDLRTEGFFSLKLFMKNFLGKSGVLANSASRFVRPLSVKDFTIREFDFKNEDIQKATVEDRLGRTWERSRVKIFESINILTYCTDLPEGVFCIGRALNVHNNHLLTIIENNFRKFVLSHLLINPFFWETDDLISFLNSNKEKNMKLMEGVGLTKKEGKLVASLKNFPLEFSLPEADKIQSVRLQTGLIGNSEKAEWAGYGMEWVQLEEDKDLVCGVGLEVFESQSSWILNYLRDRKKQEKLKKIKGEDPKPLPGIWYKPFRGLDTPFQIYGYCAPLEEDPRVSDQYFVDFKNAKPFRPKYQLR